CVEARQRPASSRGAGRAMTDRLDVVPVRIEDERAVVVRVVLGTRAGSPVVLGPRGDRSGMERIDLRVGRRADGVVAAGPGRLALGEPEARFPVPAVPAHLDAPGESLRDLSKQCGAEGGEGRVVE